METIRMTVICMTTVMLVRFQKLARMSDLVPNDLSHAEFGEMFSLNLTEKRTKSRRIDLETQTGNCFNL